MITVVEGSPRTGIWVPIKPSATVYVGSIVSLDFSAIAADEGVIVRPKAVGISNTTNKDIPIGVVVGTNRRYPLYSATYLAEYITDEGVTGPDVSTVDYVLVEGPYGKGERRAMVQIDLIGPNTVLRAPIRNAAIATAPSLLTSTSSGSKITMTTNAADFTNVAGLGTIYFRSGGNAGVYRNCDDTSATIHTYDVNTPANSAVGDTAVKVPLRMFGVSYVTIGDGTVASFIDCAVGPVTNYDVIHVLQLNLEIAGQEYVDFVFDSDAFCQVRA